MTQDKYQSARLKLDRAKHHFSEFERLTRDLLKANRLVVKPHLDGSQSSVKFKSQPLGPEFNLTFGDAVVNLRSALDHCYAVSIGAENERTGQNFFPIRDDRGSLEHWLQDTTQKRPPIPKVLQNLILDEIQPYEAGNKTLWGLNKLANIDKHRLLITVVGETSLTFSYTHGGVIFENNTFVTQAGGKAYLSTGPGTPEFKGEQKTAVRISIGEREPDFFYNEPVVTVLLSIAQEVERAIEAVALLLPRGSSQGSPL